MSWYQDKSFWKTMAPYMFNEARWEQAVEQVDGVIELLGLQPGEKVLDLCCGPGRHATELARRGFTVTGVDLNEEYLAGLRERAPGVETVHCDMREFVRPGAFDAAINLFSSFGYFDDFEEDRRVLRHLCESLRDGGRFLLDTKGKEVLARQFEPRGWHDHEDGTLLLEEREIADDWRLCHARWILLKPGGERHEFRFTTRVFSAAEIAAELRAAGFSKVEAYGWYDGRRYDHEAKRLIVAAWK